MRPEASSHRSVCPRCGTESVASEAVGGCPRCLSNALFSNEAATLSISSVGPILSDSSQEQVIRRLGDYELLEEIARGGMGIVYRARQVSLNRIVAVKLMRDSALAGTEEVRRFRVEAAAAAKLKHPHIVAIHEVGEQDGQHYFAMDLVEGTNLAQRTRECPLPPREAAELVATIAEAVQHAHERGVLHRDLKPSNVLLDSEGRPFVTDFGLARSLDTDSSLTMTGQVLGTPGYMPPEQATGQGAVGPGADIYSLGAVLYCLLTGRAPFVGGTPTETMRHVVEQEPVSPQMVNPEVPRDLASVCLKCLAKRPGDRYLSAADLSADLRHFVHGEPTLARPTGQTERLWRWCQRKPALALAIGSVALVGVIGLAGIVWQWDRARVGAERAMLNAYVADMNLASQALADNDLGRAIDLLERHRMVPSEGDLGRWEWRYLWRRTRGDEIANLGHHSDIVATVAFTPAGDFVASGSHDGTVRVWDTKTWNEICRLRAPSRVRAVAFSPDGRTLAASTLDWKVTIWDWKEQRQRAVLGVPAMGHGEGALVFTPDGETLLTGDNGVLEVRNCADFQRERRFETDQRFLSAIAVSPDGKTLATGGSDNNLKFWDTETWELKTTIPAPVLRSEVTSIQYSPDGQRILSSGYEPTVRVWSVDRLEQIGSFAGNTNRDATLARFSPDGRFIATAGGDQTIGIWDATDLHEVRQLQGHEDRVSALAYSPDGQYLVSGGDDGWVKLWSASQRLDTNSFLPLAPGITRLGLSKDGGTVIAKYPNWIEFWDTTTRQKLARFPSERIASCTSAADIVALGMTDGRVRIFTLQPPREATTLTGLHVREVDGVSLSPDGKLVASVDFTGNAQIRDWNTQEQVAAWRVRSGFCSVNFAPNGQVIATGSGDGAVETRQVTDGRLLGTLTRFKEVVSGVTFSRSVLSMDFSPDSQTLAVSSGDSTITLWEVSSSKLLATLRGNADSVGFSRDGSRLATSHDGWGIRLWDLKSQRELFTIQDESNYSRLAFAPDGNTLINVTEKGFRYWVAPPLQEILQTDSRKGQK